jgi:hypothetical protein
MFNKLASETNLLKSKSDLSVTTKCKHIHCNNLVSPKAAAKHELLFNQTTSSSLNTEVALKQGKIYDLITISELMNCVALSYVTPKAAAKHELLSNKPI